MVRAKRNRESVNARADKSKKEPMDSPSPDDWPESLDALVAAPQHHSLIFQTERVRVLQTLIPPGETTAVHTHRWPSVIHVVSASDFIRRDANGKILVDTRTTRCSSPEFLWSEPLPPHSVENVGNSEIRLIMVELKD